MHYKPFRMLTAYSSKGCMRQSKMTYNVLLIKCQNKYKYEANHANHIIAVPNDYNKHVAGFSYNK